MDVRVDFVGGVEVDERYLSLLLKLEPLVQELVDVELGLQQLDPFPAKVVSGIKKVRTGDD